MCLLCVIQKWSRRIAAMLPWLVIPLIGLWALSQLLPPAFRFEITSPRLACVFVLLFTLFWYEILMPQLSAWRVGRNARLRERKRSEAIEMHKLRKMATRRCRNCLTPYREQNPGGGRFMCSYCGHISKRPVLDLPVQSELGLPNTGILKDLVGKGGKILNGKVWSDNSWMCGDWLDNGIWVAGSFSGKPDYFWRNGGGGIFRGNENCLAKKSYSRVFVFICRVLTAFFLIIMWLWRKIFRVSNGDDESSDPEHMGMLDKRGENGEQNFQESRGEKARRKAEEKRQARLEKEQLEEEERKQREEVARLVEERRRLRDEKTEADRDLSKGLPSTRDNDYRKETEKKRQERKKEKDKGSSKSNSDVEELEKRVGNEGEWGRKAESDRRENLRTDVESIKSPNTETGHSTKTTISSNYSRGSAGTRYFDRMRGTFLSSSKAFTGAGFFRKGASTSVVSRDLKSISSVDHVHNSASRKELSQPECLPGKLNSSGDDKSINHPVVSELQPYTAPRKSWQQLFNRSATVPPSATSTVISRPIGKFQSEAQNLPFSFRSVATQQYDNPINFGLPSPFPLSAFPYESTGNSKGIQLPSESGFPPIGEAASEFLPEESDIFEDPCYIPDPASLLGPVSESLDNFQLDLGFVTDNGLEKLQSVRNIPSSSDVIRPSPIESPMSRLRVTEERQASSLLSQCTLKGQDVYNFPKDDLRNTNEKGTWQMWKTSPLGQDGLGLVGGTASWLSSPELTRSNKEDNVYPLPQKTMASLFRKDDQVPCGTYSQHNVLVGSCQKGGALGNSMSGTIDDPWLPETLFGQTSGCEKHFLQRPTEEAIQNVSYNRSPNGFAANQPFELSSSNLWANKKWTLPAMGESIGNSSITRPPVGGGLYNLDQSLWSTMTEEK